MTIPEIVYITLGASSTDLFDSDEVIEDMVHEQAFHMPGPFHDSFLSNGCEDSMPHQPRRKNGNEKAPLGRHAWSRQDSFDSLVPPVCPRRTSDAGEMDVRSSERPPVCPRRKSDAEEWDNMNKQKPPVFPRRTSDADEVRVIDEIERREDITEEHSTNNPNGPISPASANKRFQLQRHMSGLSSRSGTPRQPQRRRSIFASSA